MPSCEDCKDNKADKLSVYEPIITPNETKVVCLCANNREKIRKNTRITSTGENLVLEMRADSASNYFKTNYSLFEASYKFVHEPLCGPPIIKAKSDGELHFPHHEALGFIDPPRSVHCVWDLQVHENRDLSLFFDKVKLVSRDCRDGRIEINLPNSRTPIEPACGHNITALKNIRLITSEELVPKLAVQPYRHVQIHFVSSTTPTRASFKLVWSELFHVEGKHHQ